MFSRLNITLNSTVPNIECSIWFSFDESLLEQCMTQMGSFDHCFKGHYVLHKLLKLPQKGTSCRFQDVIFYVPV